MSYGPIAVIDVETTGLFTQLYNRVIEVAVVVIGPDGGIEREFVSLVNPVRDIGPSRIHGLTSEDVLHAPQFAEIAAMLLDTLSGTVAIAGHSVYFDRKFLEIEFSRLQHQLPDCLNICTMQLAGGGRLTDCCRDHGISPESEFHHALNDARATAQLLTRLLADQPGKVQEISRLLPIHWPTVPRTTKQPVTRDDSRRRQSEPPTFLNRLLGQKHLERRHDNAFQTVTDGPVMIYAALLDRVLEDRYIDESEGDALVETATQLGLSQDQILQTHCGYLDQLAVAAVADGIVTDAELRDLKLVAVLLGQEKRDLDELLKSATAKMPEMPPVKTSDEQSLIGMRVCFTGELRCYHGGRLLTRDHAQELAVKAGLVVTDSVTKKLDLLVLADPQTQSGKAKKARTFGVRIMHEPVFWKYIGVNVE